MTTESDDPIRFSLEYLVHEYGLPAVYKVLRSFPGYCGNCGTPLEDEITHIPGGLGMCYSERLDK